MRHPDQFCIGFDPALDWKAHQKEVLSSGLKPEGDLMQDDNIFYLNHPSSDVLYLMIEYKLSRGEAEFILNSGAY